MVDAATVLGTLSALGRALSAGEARDLAQRWALPAGVVRDRRLKEQASKVENAGLLLLERTADAASLDVAELLG
jgi:hypothetical protein